MRQDGFGGGMLLLLLFVALRSTLHRLVLASSFVDPSRVWNLFPRGGEKKKERGHGSARSICGEEERNSPRDHKPHCSHNRRRQGFLCELARIPDQVRASASKPEDVPRGARPRSGTATDLTMSLLAKPLSRDCAPATLPLISPRPTQAHLD